MAYDYNRCREMDYDEFDARGCRNLFLILLTLTIAIAIAIIRALWW